MTDVGKRIRERRIELGMTQEELALRVGYKTRGSINKLELCRDIPIYKLKPIADALDIDVRVLMGWMDDEEEIATAATVAADLTDDPELAQYVAKIIQLDDKSKAQIYSLIDLLLTK